jgi:hypothetical protein
MAASTAAVVRTMRLAMPAAVVAVRWRGVEVQGVRGSSMFADAFGAGGAIQGVAGAVRLIVSELIQPVPVAGDLLPVPVTPGGTPVTREILSVDYDKMAETMLVTYGERHG